MTRRRTKVLPKCGALCACLYVMICRSLDVVAFRAAPVIAGQAARGRRHASCVELGAGREVEGRGREQETADGIFSVTPCSRKDVLQSMGLFGSAMVCGQALAERAQAADMRREELPTVGKITKSGIKYFDYRVGEGPMPSWGQDCIVRFTMYGRSAPDEKLIKIQSSENNKEHYLFKHGNGLQIKGMEEGMHTMRVGGKRRVILPQDLGYTVQGLGPYPAEPKNRETLIKVLTSFEKVTTGELVMDIELLDAFDDEADQGYYEDTAVTPEQLQALIQEKGEGAAGAPLEKFKGQIASPMEDTSSKRSDGGLPGQLGKDVLGG